MALRKLCVVEEETPKKKVKLKRKKSKTMKYIKFLIATVKVIYYKMVVGKTKLLISNCLYCGGIQFDMLEQRVEGNKCYSDARCLKCGAVNNQLEVWKKGE